MKYSLLILIFVCSCSVSKKSILVIDNDLNFSNSSHQIILLGSRGNYTYGQFSKNADLASGGQFLKSQSKAWILTNWGSPDKEFTKNHHDYLVYDQKNSYAPNYGLQFAYGESQIELKYNGDKLVSISAYFEDRPKFGGKNPYILPQ